MHFLLEKRIIYHFIYLLNIKHLNKKCTHLSKMAATIIKTLVKTEIKVYLCNQKTKVKPKNIKKMEPKNNSTERNNLIAQAYISTRDYVFAIFRQARIPAMVCEDLTSDVFMKLMEIDLLKEDTVKRLVTTIAYHKRIDYLRHRAYVRNHAKECMDATMLEGTPSYTDGMSTVLCNEIADIEMKVVARMSETDCKVYCLNRFEEKNAAEIAELLNITTRAAETRIYRTRITVRGEMRKAINM